MAMICSAIIGDKTYSFDAGAPLDISIPLQFDGPQPNLFGVPAASSKAYEDGKFVGDTRRGGGCNFDEVRLIPHCNGTHTECVGHIAHERISVSAIHKGSLIPAMVVTVEPEEASSSSESYKPEKRSGEWLITAKKLFYLLSEADKDFLQGLIIRTKPNDPSKKSLNYLGRETAYFSLEAMNYLVDLDIKHLLVDLSSVDRKFDEGRLSTHHIFWDVMQGSHDIDPAACSLKTITELIYVDDKIPDGRYLLDIQIPSFLSDAAPSRPLIYEVKSSVS